MAALTANGVGTCGADDNQAQAGHLIVTALTTRAGATFDDQQIGQLVVDVLGDQSHTLTEDHDASEDGTGRGAPVVAFHLTQDPISGDISPAMSAGNKQGCATIGVAQSVSEKQRGELNLTEHAALTSGGGKPGQGYPATFDGVIVRRLTPIECERLQGAPDGWTDVDSASDSARYRQLGNSVAVPVLEWALTRLAAVDARTREAGAA